jgi:capsid assembly protease
VAVVDPEAASAGYWLASQANRIVALKSGWVGSLGSQAMVYSMKRMYDEEGIDIEVLRADISPKKNQGIPYEAITDEARKERQGWVDMAGNQFVEHVMRGRGKTRDEVLKNFGQGAMFFAEDAISRGMVDTIGNLQSELAVESVSSPAERMSNRNRIASSLRARLNDRRPG